MSTINSGDSADRRTEGSLHGVVSLPLMQIMEGMKDAEQDVERGTITDCPYHQNTLSAKAWWSGYHYSEKREANAALCDSDGRKEK